MLLQSKQPEFDLHGLTLVGVIGAWLVGILLEAWFTLPAFALLLGACTALLWLIPLRRDQLGRLIMLAILLLLLGAWRYAIASPFEDSQNIAAYVGTGVVTLQGSVADEPKLAGKTRLLLITTSSISKNQGTNWQPADGQLEAQTLDTQIEDPYGANYGDTVEVQGKLLPPTQYTPPGVFAMMAFPRITVTQSGGNPLIAALYHLRVSMAAIIAQSLPQPEASLLIAILLSLRTPALTSLILSFNVTGTAHLIAPSGFKVTVLAGLIVASTQWLYEGKAPQTRRLLPAQKAPLNRRRWLATSVVMVSIAAYTILNGAGPAALRAGIMGILLVVAPRIGRIYNIYTALAFAALLMSSVDPYILWDVGFQLSLFGTLGIVLLTPLLQRPFHPLARLRGGHACAEIIAVTLAAQIATLPILATDFHQVSFIAPLTNILTVPLLGVLLFLGMLICGAGLVYGQLGILCGWLATPLLWYVIRAVTWCAALPGAFLSVTNVNSSLCWGYYALLTLLVGFLLYRWPSKQPSHSGNAPAPLLSKRTWRLLQLGAAIVILLATTTTVLATRPDGNLHITFLNVGPANQPPQGEAIFIQTPDGKTALIDGGLDATSLAQELDSHLPSWQRSIDVVLLTTPRTDALSGLQDVVSRYQIGEVFDAGMLHPSTGYALWRRTIAERNMTYMQVRQGATLTLGTQVVLQILLPSSTLHKGSNEELDSALVVRLIAPGLRMLLLGVAALSKYALTSLLDNIAPSYLQAEIVQIVAEVSKNLPSQLGTLLQAVKASMIVITPASLSPKQRKTFTTTALNPLPAMLKGSAWQTLQTAQIGTIEINSSNQGWALNV